MSHSQQLRSKIRLVSSRLDAAARALWNHPQLARILPEYLFKNHSVVRASVPLMNAALECARTRFGSDPVAVGTAAYLAKHIPEEMNHDYWLVEDMETLGIDSSAVLKRMPSGRVAALVGSQYYWIYHFHPVCLLGYIAVLEGTPPTASYFEQVAKQARIPNEAFSSVFRHAKIDPQHRADLDNALDELPLTADHAAMLGVSAIHTAHLLSEVIEELLDLPDAVAAGSAPVYK